MGSTSSSSISSMLKAGISGMSGDVSSTSVSVMGSPYRYQSLADPNDRMYTETFMEDMCTVTFYPGKPKYRKTDPEIVSKAESFFDGDNGDGEDSFLKSVTRTAKQGSTNYNIGPKDYRYYRFEEDYDEYLKYLDLMIEVAGSRMGISGSVSGHFAGKNFKTRGVSFYAGTQANVSESFSNQFGDSQLASTSKQMSDAAKEMQFLTGNSEGAFGKASGLASGVTNAITSLTKTLSLSSSVDNAVGEINNGIQSALYGMNMAYPQIWKDSSFSRSYSMTFEFYSPYGHPDAIFGNIYVPFLSLLTLAAPRQNMTSSYGSPFILRVDCPGYFTSDLAVITSIDWKKGGNDNLWTKDGLPLAMTVSVTVADLFPVMFIAKDENQLAHNSGLHGFLRNMGGFNISDINLYADVKEMIDKKVGSIKGMLDGAWADFTRPGWKLTFGRHVNM